jgi:prepilin peptidase CpaA
MMDATTLHGPVIILSILAVAVWYDVRQHRIPNALSLGGIVLGVMLQVWTSGLSGLAAGLGGTAVAAGIFLPFHLLQGMGAGDVKLMGAAGAFLGPHDALLATGLSLAAGGVMALAILLVRGGLSPLARRYWATLKCLLVTHKLIHQPPVEGEVAAMKFPYAAAIGIGTLAAMLWLSISQSFSGLLVQSIR